MADNVNKVTQDTIEQQRALLLSFQMAENALKDLGKQSLKSSIIQVR